VNQHFRKTKLRDEFNSYDEKQEKHLGYRPRSWKEQQEIANLSPAPHNPVETVVNPKIEG
jgi:hypothetical protein